MFNSKQINNFQERIFNIFIFVSWSLIIISALGFSQNAPKFLSDLDYYVSIYICLFLMWRFHPFKTKYEFTNLDRKIAFTAGLFIFTTTALHKYLLQVQDQIKKVL
jgi:hypothetical protein